MSPLVFIPLPLPHDASKLFWFTLAAMLVVGTVLDRRGAPKSVSVLIALGYVFGLFYGGGDRGGLAGAIAGLMIGLAASRISSRRPPL